MMHLSPRLTACALILLVFPVLTGFGSTFSVSGRTILLDGQPFAVRGVCWQPTPIGEDPSAGDPFADNPFGAFGDYYTAGFSAYWARDLPNIRKMGANVIRMYSWTAGANHTAFLDTAYNGGNQPLYVLINRYINPETDWNSPSQINALITEWQTVANEVKNHPAIMGFLIGNEVNGKVGNGDNPAFWNVMNQIAGAVKAIAPNKLVSVAIIDTLNQVAIQDPFMTSFDFWAMQVYRGSSFGSFFTDYAASSPKPLIVTEFGYDAYDARIGGEFVNNAELPANAMETLWNEIEANASIVAGGCVFEYADEWWKSGSPLTHDAPPGWSGAFADGEGNEEWWGFFRTVNNGLNPDIVQPRAMFYRLAAMWNPPFPSVLAASGTGSLMEVTFEYPDHMRDQQLALSMSSNLSTWPVVATNNSTQYLDSSNPDVTVTNNVVNDRVNVTVQYDLSAAGNPVLLSNGDFDIGSAAGWETPGIATDTFAESGTHSLQLTGLGGFSVPSAFQTVPASPGDEFRLGGYMYTPVALPPNATFGLFKIVFKDIGGNDLQPASVSSGQFAPDIDFPGAESLPFLNVNSIPGNWIWSQAQAVAPAGTVSVSFFVINVDETAATMYFDTVEAVDVNGPPPGYPKVFFRLENSGR